MARQIQYDVKALRQNLLSVFWAQGYAETSLSDLEAATKLNRRQLYNGVGDKRAMFLQALDDFSETAGQQYLSALETEDAGVKDIDALLQTFVGLAATNEGSHGCLICSTSQENIASDIDVDKRIDAYFDRIRAAYEHALRRAVSRGEIALSDAGIASRAEMLFGVHVALCVLGRAGQPNDRLARMAAQAVADIT